MKRRSKIAAIFLSLSIMGSAQANSWSTIFAGVTLINAGPYIGALINSATNMANLYLNVQNNRKINEVSQQVAAVDKNVVIVNGNVLKVQAGLGHTNHLMSTLHTTTKIGLQDLNTKVDTGFGVVHRNLEALREQRAQDMEALTEQNNVINNNVTLVGAGVQGVHDRLDAQAKDLAAVRVQGADTQTQLTQMNDRLEAFSAFATTGMQQLASIDAMLKLLISKKDSTTTTTTK